MRLQKNTKFILLFIALLTSFYLVQAQQLRASAEVDSLRLLIGSPLTLTLRVEHQADLSLELPPYAAGSKLGRLEVLKVEEPQISTIGEYQRLSQQLTLSAFDSGYFYLPAQRVIATQNGENPLLATTDSILIRFDYPVVDTTQAYKPIKGIYAVPLTFQDIWPWLAGGILVLALLGGLWYGIVHKQKKAGPPPPQAAPLPAHEIAMRKLSQLEAARYWQKGQAREYYFELSYILREYIEKRFFVPALESTTDDILRHLEPKLPGRDSLERLQGLLQMAELAKFAKFEPTQQENLDNMDQARQFVQKTRNTQEPEPEEETQSATEVVPSQELKQDG